MIIISADFLTTLFWVLMFYFYVAVPVCFLGSCIGNAWDNWRYEVSEAKRVASQPKPTPKPSAAEVEAQAERSRKLCKAADRAAKAARQQAVIHAQAETARNREGL